MTTDAAFPPFLADLERRGLLKDKTEGISEPDFKLHPRLYVGFDPTATSLHAGSLIPLLGMDRFRRRGGQIVILQGGATGLIGDPSGKEHERTLESREVVEERAAKMGAQMARFFERTDGPKPIVVNNADWYRQMDVISFLRDVGKHFSVNQMLVRESVRARIENREQGISFTEFSYQLLQAYDFLHLFRTYDCKWQMGASDQWGNIVSGIDLIRRCTGQEAHGLTLPLLTNAEGKKYGKSEKGAVWLDPSLTSAYEFYQFWFNSADADAPRFLTWLTDFEPAEIAAFQSAPPSERVPQKRLAHTLTARVHGEDQASTAQQASEVVFSGRFDQLTPGVVEMLSAAVPTYVAKENARCPAGEVLLAVGAAKSKSEARRLADQKALVANGQPLSSVDDDLRERAAGRPAVLLAVGKNRRYLVRLGP